MNDPKHEQVGAKHETVGKRIRDFMEGPQGGPAPGDPPPPSALPVDAPLPARVPGLWYAVAAQVLDPDAAPDADRGLVWTLSRDPDAPGWETDKATAGYGMPRHVAESIVTILNAAAVFGAVVPDA